MKSAKTRRSNFAAAFDLPDTGGMTEFLPSEIWSTLLKRWAVEAAVRTGPGTELLFGMMLARRTQNTVSF